MTGVQRGRRRDRPRPHQRDRRRHRAARRSAPWPARASPGPPPNPAVVTAERRRSPARRAGRAAATATLTAHLTKGHEVATPGDRDHRAGGVRRRAVRRARPRRPGRWPASTTSAATSRCPTAGEFGSTITWAASPDVITPTGEVTRPAYGRPDAPRHADRHAHQGRGHRDQVVRRHGQGHAARRGSRSATSSATSRARARPTASSCASRSRPATTRWTGSASPAGARRSSRSWATRACATRSSSARPTATPST